MNEFQPNPATTVTIRPLELNDLAAVYQLLVEVSPFQPGADKYLSVYDRVSRQRNALLLCAVDTGVVVGFASIFYATRVRGGDVALIEDVIVDTAYRRVGIGHMLINELVRDAEIRGATKVILESSDMARPFYEAHGFELGGPLLKKNLVRTL